MVYLSANGEVLGHFEEKAVPGLLADGTVTDAAFFWREGMSEWRPLAELPKPEPKKIEPIQPAAPAPAKQTLVLPGAEAKVGVESSEHAVSAVKKTFVARRGPGGAAPSGAAPMARAAAAAPNAAASEPARPGALQQTKPSAAAAVVPQGGVAGAPRAKRRGWLVWLSGLLVLAAAAGGGAWWWIMNAEPPVIPGTVVLAGDESGLVQVRVFRRAELVAPWRERLAAAESRGAEIDGQLATAQAELREKSVLRDEAARVCEVGEEYNMPDVAELRADRDAKQAAADAAQAEVAKLETEKGTLLTFESLLESVPDPLRTVVADASGSFSLPPPEGDVFLLATATVESDGQRQQRAWLEILEAPVDGETAGPVRFSETNRLDVEAIRRFSAGE